MIFYTAAWSAIQVHVSILRYHPQIQSLMVLLLEHENICIVYGEKKKKKPKNSKIICYPNNSNILSPGAVFHNIRRDTVSSHLETYIMFS